jgi:hypothetical protein
VTRSCLLQSKVVPVDSELDFPCHLSYTIPVAPLPEVSCVDEVRSYYGEGVDLSLRLAGACRLASSEVAVCPKRFLSYGQVCLRHPQPHSLHPENI